MKLQPSNKGFSLLELLVVMAIIAMLAAFFIPNHARSTARAKRIKCVSHLKQIGIGLRLWRVDQENPKYPTYNQTNAAWNYFQTIGQEIGSPIVLLCPEDASRKKAALDFGAFLTTNSFSDPGNQNNALSYFYGVDSSEEKFDMFLAGDRSLSTNSTILSGVLSVDTNTAVQWAKGMHQDGGNVGFADGSVQQISSRRLGDLVQTGTNGTQRLLIP